MPIDAGYLALVESHSVYSGLGHSEIPDADRAGLLSCCNEKVGVDIVECGAV